MIMMPPVVMLMMITMLLSVNTMMLTQDDYSDYDYKDEIGDNDKDAMMAEC